MGSITTNAEKEILRFCGECGNEFYAKHNTKGLYCSKPCKYKNGRRNYRAVKDGYIWIYPDVDKYPVPTDYSGTLKDGRIREHRFVMQEFLKRSLREDETVHHINGNKMDNRIENLELWVGNHGKGVRASDLHTCPMCNGSGVI